ncbi:hypothetical protein JCM10296v2_001071 [Rhodotorula toruloides]
MPSLKRPLSAHDSPDAHRSPDHRVDAVVLRGASPSSNKRVRRDDIEQDSSPATWVAPWGALFTQGFDLIKEAAKSAYNLATTSANLPPPSQQPTRRLSAPTSNGISPLSRRELKQLRQEYKKIKDELVWHRMEARARGGEVSKDSPKVFDLEQQLKALKLKIEGGERAKHSQPAAGRGFFGTDASPARTAGGSNGVTNGASGTPGLLGGYQRRKPMGSDKKRISSFPTTLNSQPRPRTKPRAPSPSDFVVPTLHAHLSPTPGPAGPSDNPRPPWAPTWNPALSPQPPSMHSTFLEPHRSVTSPPSELPADMTDSPFSSRLFRLSSPEIPSLARSSARTASKRTRQHKADLANRDRATVAELRRDAQLRKAASTNDVRTRYRGLEFDVDDEKEAPEAEDALEERVYRQRNEQMLKQEDAKLDSKHIKLHRARAGETAMQHRIPLTTSSLVRPSALDRSLFFPGPSAYPTKNGIIPSSKIGRSASTPGFEYVLQQAKKTMHEPTREALERYEQMQKELKELDEKAELEPEDVKQKKRQFPKALSAEHQARAKAIFANRAYDVSMKGGSAAHRDIIRLKDRTWLNDEIVNFYGAMINARSDEADKREAKEGPKARGEGVKRLRKAFCFNTHFWKMFGDHGFSRVKRWTKRFDTFEKDIIIVPINHNNSHWVCAAVNIALKRFEYYDSLGNPSAFVYDRLRRWLAEEHKSKKGGKDIDLSDWENFWMEDVPLQANADDCGVFTCMFMESLSRDVDGFDFKQKNMPYLRHRIAIEIDQQKLLDLEPWA